MIAMTKELARLRVEAEIGASGCGLPEGDSWMILDELTIDRAWGWVFFYTSRTWHETGDFRYAVAGNAPILVERETGLLRITGTARPIGEYIETYERTGDPHGEHLAIVSIEGR